MNTLRQQMSIRELAQGRRGHAEWGQVCGLLDELSDDEVLAHVLDLEVDLHEWLPEFRETPRRWVKRLQSEGHEPRTQLCRVLGLSSSPHLDELWRVLGSPDVARIVVLGSHPAAHRCARSSARARGVAAIVIARLGRRRRAGARHAGSTPAASSTRSTPPSSTRNQEHASELDQEHAGELDQEHAGELDQEHAGDGDRRRSAAARSAARSGRGAADISSAVVELELEHAGEHGPRRRSGCHVPLSYGLPPSAIRQRKRADRGEHWDVMPDG